MAVRRAIGAGGGADDLERDAHRIAARHEKTHLPGLFAVILRHRAEAALPEGGGIGQLVGAGNCNEGFLRRGRCDLSLPQFVRDGAFAVTSGTLRHERLRETRVRQIPQALQLVERLLDFRRRAAARGQAIGKFGAAVLAPREQANGEALERRRGLARIVARAGASRFACKRQRSLSSA